MGKAFLLASTVLCAAHPARAQSAPTTPQTTAQPGTGIVEATPDTPVAPEAATSGDIIVTAQRRDESLSRTPVAVAVVTSDALAKANIVSEQDLRTAAPGLSVRAGLNSNTLNYSLRGQSQDPYSGTRPGVLPYLNEVQIGGSGGSSAFYDLQSVQVLKGPQGTLFGRSATGGAVLYTSAAPTEEAAGYFSVLGGNYRAFKAEGAVSGPLDKDGHVLARFAFLHQQRNGYQRNLYDGSRVGDLKRDGLRGSLSLRFGGFRNDTVVDYFHSDSENTAGILSGLMPLGAPGTPPYVPIEFLYAGTATPTARATGIGTVQAFLAAAGPSVQALVPAYYDAYFADPRHPAGGITAVLKAQRARGPYVVDYDGPNFYRAENVIVTNKSELDLGSGLMLRNIFGYTHLDQNTATDADGTPYTVSQTDQPGGILDLTEQVSEELQLQGKVLDDKLDFVAGGYYSDESNFHDQDSTFFDILLGRAFQTYLYRLKNKTRAGYAQGTFHLTDALAFTLGARYTSEKVSKQTLPGDTLRGALGEPPPPGYSYGKSRTFNKLSWQIGLQDQVSRGLLVYAVSRRAYKSGGFNGTVAPIDGTAAEGGDGFDAERVTDVEIGGKYNGFVGTMPVRTNVALFYNWIRDSQRAAFSLIAANPASLTVNVPTGKTYGAEFDLNASPTRWLNVGGTFNYTRATYGTDPVQAGFSFAPGPVTVVSQVYDQVTDTPRFSGSVFADVTVPLGDSGIRGLLHGDWYGQTKAFTSPRSVNNAGTVLRGYGLFNLRAGIDDPGQGWSITANVKNLTDKVYYVGGQATGEIYQINLLVPGEPRTFTVEARFKF